MKTIYYVAVREAYERDRIIGFFTSREDALEGCKKYLKTDAEIWRDEFKRVYDNPNVLYKNEEWGDMIIIIEEFKINQAYKDVCLGKEEI